VGYAVCRLIQNCAVVTVIILGVTGPILIKFEQDVATLLATNIFESELAYPFRNASLPNECHFANFAQNWLPWQRPLISRKKRSRSIILPIFREKIVKIGPVDRKIIGFQETFKKKQRNKLRKVNCIYSSVGKLAELAKILSDVSPIHG